MRDALDTLAASYRKGQSARHQLLLQPQPQRRGPAGAAAGAAGEHLPGDYACKVVTRAEAVQAAAAAAKTGGGAAALRRHFPPASTEADSYTVLKFHPLDDAMLHAGGWVGGWEGTGRTTGRRGSTRRRHLRPFWYGTPSCLHWRKPLAKRKRTAPLVCLCSASDGQRGAG